MTYLPTFSGLRGSRLALRSSITPLGASTLLVGSGASANEELCRDQDRCRENARDNVVQHNSQPAGQTVIGLADRPGLDDIEEAEQDESAGQPIPIGRSCQHRHGITRDLIPDDPRMIVHAQAPRALAA